MISTVFGLLRPFLPYIIVCLAGAAIGGASAWKIQGLRITAAKQEFTDYKQEQTRLIQEAEDAADRKRDTDERLYNALAKDLKDEIAKGEVFHRCVAAGKCGRLPNVPAGSGCAISAARRADDRQPDAVPPAGDDAAPEVIGDCAATTLQLNQLQAGIESQPGY
jgi:hypothetical protein